MQQTVIVGTDVSKFTLDFCFRPCGNRLKTTNDQTGFKCWMKQLKKCITPDTRILVIMEHTGYYSLKFEKYLKSKSIGFCKLPALEIKRSLGVTRGKTDQIDAERIAEYGWLRREILMADPVIDDQIMKLRSLLSLRLKLVRDRASYMVRLKETAVVSNREEMKMQNQIIDMFSKKITQINSSIKDLIYGNQNLRTTCELLCSIKGVGWTIAAHMIACTNNFKRFNNARKFNCYAGLAPFKMESGTSIKVRARISQLANKNIKTLLNLAAFSAIRFDEELKQYYQRRLAEGKRKMSCVNIVRSKIVARMFAVIKRQTSYQEHLIAA